MEWIKKLLEANSTWITWVFSGIGLFPFSVVCAVIGWLVKRRISHQKPELILEGLGHPIGGHQDRNNQTIDAIYKFKFTNVGEKPALLGDDPLRTADVLDIIKRELNGQSMPKLLVAIPESQRVPNLLQSKRSFNLDVVLGHYDNRVMKDPFSFSIYYSDTRDKQYKTVVQIRPQTGDIVKLKQKQIGILSRFISLFQFSA